MRHLPNIHDQMRDVSTYELDDGSRVTITNGVLRNHDAATVLHEMGLGPDPAEMPRRPVYHCGTLVGTLPGSFDPLRVRSRTWLYDPRPGDFVADGDGWRAAPTLGPGDIEAIEGFRSSSRP